MAPRLLRTATVARPVAVASKPLPQQNGLQKCRPSFFVYVAGSTLKVTIDKVVLDEAVRLAVNVQGC